MKRHILFVDDEPLVLEGLRRMLRDLREAWQLDFAESGQAALRLMERQAYDVVVADMRMPGMTGAELLAQVMQRYPQTIRLILSGHADKDLVMQCVGATHQYLSKPCDAEMLRATIQRAARTEASLQNTALRRLVGRMERLPSLSSVYVEVLNALKDPDRDLSDIGRILTQDIAMTAQVLKLVNSAFFGLQREITEPAEAVHYLGVETLKTLVLSTHLFTEFQWVRAPGFSLQALSQHSLATARAGKAIADLEDAGRRFAEEVFCAGMLHDAGKLVLVQNFPVPYCKILQVAKTNAEPVDIVERRVLGATHAEVGGYLLGLWGLPVRVVEAIALHHLPTTGSFPGLSPLLVVSAANALVKETATPTDPCPDSDPLRQALEQEGLADRWPRWREAVADVLTEGATL